MGNLVDYLCDQYKPYELVQVAERLGLAPVSQWSQHTLVETIIKRVKDEGLPANLGADPVAALTADFLYVAEITDESGVVVAGKGDREQKPSLEEYMAAHAIKKAPPCYSFGDDADVACKRCPIYEYCAESRLANLPACFGQLYDANDLECKACIESPYCKTKL